MILAGHFSYEKLKINLQAKINKYSFNVNKFIIKNCKDDKALRNFYFLNFIKVEDKVLRNFYL